METAVTQSKCVTHVPWGLRLLEAPLLVPLPPGGTSALLLCRKLRASILTGTVGTPRTKFIVSVAAGEIPRVLCHPCCWHCWYCFCWNHTSWGVT